MASIASVPITVKLTTVLPMAWRHDSLECGSLNDSAWPIEEVLSVCRGCHEGVAMGDVVPYLLVVIA